MMVQSYRGHPGFSFDSSGWRCPDEAVLRFNKAYAVVRTFGSSLNRASVNSLCVEMAEALKSAFGALQEQAADRQETYFNAELKSACERLLADELAWYAKPHKVDFVDLRDVGAVSNAFQMQMSRHFFGRLPEVAVAELRSLASDDLNRFRESVKAGRLRREDLSVNTGSTVRAIRSVLNREFKSLGVLDVISAYTARKMQVVGLSLELSVPQASWWKNAIIGLSRPPETLYAHLDETISCPKSIVYLSDVTDVNGPTGCYPGAYEALQLNPLQELIGRVVGTVGSNGDSPLKEYYAKQYHQSVNSENFRKHFMRLPERMRFNSHMGWDVLPGSELEGQLANTEQKMIGPAGTFIAFDGARLLHRGGLMQEGERLALQVIFSDMTFTQRAVNKLKRVLS